MFRQSTQKTSPSYMRDTQSSLIRRKELELNNHWQRQMICPLFHPKKPYPITRRPLFFQSAYPTHYIQPVPSIRKQGQHLPDENPRPFGGYEQDRLLRQLHRYLKQAKRCLPSQEQKHILNSLANPISLGGYCHGLTLLWLYKMSEGKEQWFYDMVRYIIDCRSEKLIEYEVDIEKFLALIEWGQNSEHYLSSVNYQNMDTILEVQKKYTFYNKHFDRETFIEFLSQYLLEHHLISIVGAKDQKHLHTVGIYRRGNKCFLYNANFSLGKALQKDIDYGDLHAFSHCILQSLYTDFGVSIPRAFSLSIAIAVNPHCCIPVQQNKAQTSIVQPNIQTMRRPL